ncbi:MAG: phosphoribosylglycinamide formyltransferase [bacterium]
MLICFIMANNIGILASTRGADMQALIDAIAKGKLDARIAVVISDKEESYALERTRQHNLKSVFISPKGLAREEYDRLIAQELQKEGVELILLIGYMRYLSRWFVDQYKNRIMNIHPSLLPAFAGGMDKNVHQAVLDHGCKVSGCTLHFVDEGEDTGSIIKQAAVNILETETADSLKEKVQKAEQELIIEGIKLFFKNKLKVNGKKVEILAEIEE